MGVRHPFVIEGRRSAWRRAAAFVSEHVGPLVGCAFVALSATTQWVASQAGPWTGSWPQVGRWIDLTELAASLLLLASWLVGWALVRWTGQGGHGEVMSCLVVAWCLGVAALGPLYIPGAFVAWMIEPAIVAPAARLASLLWLVLATFGGVAVLTGRAQADDYLHGSARFADRYDLQSHRLLGDRGIVLGWQKRRGFRERWQAIRHDGVEHVLVLGETRAGKTSEQLIPTLLDWEGHVVIGDFKDGELYQRTAGALADNGFRVIRFDPLGNGGVRWNPLLEIEPGQGEIGELMTLAEALIPIDGQSNPYFPRAARELFVCLALHVLYTHPPGQRSIGAVRDLLLTGLDDGAGKEVKQWDEGDQTSGDPQAQSGSQQAKTGAGAGLLRLFRQLAKADHDPGKLYISPWKTQTHDEVRRITGGLIETPAKELGSIGSALRQALQTWADPFVRRNTVLSDFKLGLVRRDPTPTAIYMTIPLAEMDRLAPLIRLFVVAAAKRLTELGEYVDQAVDRRQIHRALMILEEFPSMGKVEYVSRMLSTVGGYGLTMMLCVQTLSQLKTTYGANEPISGGCPVLVVNPTKDLETMRAVSRWSGEMTVLRPKVTSSQSWTTAASTTHVEEEVKRPLLTEGEVRALPEGRGVVFYPACPPILTHKRGYYRIPEMLAQSERLPPAQSRTLVDPFCLWSCKQPVRSTGMNFFPEKSSAQGDDDAS